MLLERRKCPGYNSNKYWTGLTLESRDHTSKLRLILLEDDGIFENSEKLSVIIYLLKNAKVPKKWKRKKQKNKTVAKVGIFDHVIFTVNY